MSRINLKTLTEYQLNELYRAIEHEQLIRAAGPKVTVYEVNYWGDVEHFADVRCALLSLRDNVDSLESSGAIEKVVEISNSHNLAITGIRPVEIFEADFLAKQEQNYFDDADYQARLEER